MVDCCFIYTSDRSNELTVVDCREITSLVYEIISLDAFTIVVAVDTVAVVLRFVQLERITVTSTLLFNESR